MISSKISNRLVFIFSLLGLAVSAFLFYEYSLTGSVNCPIGNGCDIVRNSPYSKFLGISLPVLGILFYLSMSIAAIIKSLDFKSWLISKFQLFAAIFGVGFGIYLTSLEAFVIKAYCFWCVLSFIISILILLVIIFSKKENLDENRD